ncbi:glycosyltransferase [Butyrivibrio proteoclasticus]|uniref:glycosyltransferase n=1 Tax=Butyrivibrio proteoclasticus TaxID=43305 RepID=UPI001A9A5A41|nr:glycosyltransferase [Butyrivibrio proteoclasticus]
MDSFVLFPVIKKIGIKISGWGLAFCGEFIGVFSEKRISSLIRNLMAREKCCGVFIHHLKWSNLDALQRILSFSKEIVFFVHDYYSCCFQTNLLKNDVAFCGDARLYASKCSDCVYYSKSLQMVEKIKWFLGTFNKVTVIAPSETAAGFWKEVFPMYAGNVRVEGHFRISNGIEQTVRKIPENGKLNVAFVGDGIHAKGADLWYNALDCLSEEVREKYNFYHMGSHSPNNKNIICVPIENALRGNDYMTQQLIQKKIDVAVLFSVVPETYSFTFFEALKARCFVITNGLSGNIAKLVKENRNGIIIEPDTDSLVKVLSDISELKKMVGEYYKRASFRQIILEHNDAYKECFKYVEMPQEYGMNIPNDISTAWIADVLYRIRYRKML